MEKSKLAGKTVKLKINQEHDNVKTGASYIVEDWWINVGGQSWMGCLNGNPACMIYGVRSGFAGLPIDDKVLYGKIAGAGYLIHESEIVVEK